MWPFSRTLEDAIAPKKVKVHGIKFKIKKINPVDHLSGAKIMQQMYETYQTSDDKSRAALAFSADKIKSHYVDVFMSSVVSPVLCRKIGGDGIFVENLFTDWGLAEELYSAIMVHTYGKKKLNQFGFHAKNSLNWTT